VHVRELFDLTGLVALVSGGSRGLGLEIAEGLAEAGARLALTGRRKSWLDEAGAKLRERGADPLALEIDVADAGGPRRAVAETAARFGGVDLLINNAGISWGAPSLDYPEDRWRQVLEVDLTGAWRMCQAAAPRMIERGGGRIVMVSSIAGLVGTAPEVQDTVAYAAAKAGLNGLTRDLAVKWARHGINVNAVAPGYFPTRLTAPLIERNEPQMRALSPLGRLGREGELKGVVVFLCSRAASYVTGQILAVDGGMTAA
jgi:gluconate 5-dehydrogenase